MESKVESHVVSDAITASRLEASKSEKIEVKNSGLLEGVLMIVCVCFTIFMTMKMYVYVKKNFLGRPKPMRSSSEHTLAMNVDYE